ncbi:S-adenosyl-L-methionine-dependent methyltransferase [Gautieria morchelliformis]|nr:S-adenosyl-L-methionine-dependent methyltransferase [Gautieria morchelliformis]
MIPRKSGPLCLQIRNHLRTKSSVKLHIPHARLCGRKRLPTLTDTTILQCVCTPGAPPPTQPDISSLFPGMRILDVGCGPGTITADLAPKGHVTALEYAPEVLMQARSTAAQRGLTNIEFVVGDVNWLDFLTVRSMSFMPTRSSCPSGIPYRPA